MGTFRKVCLAVAVTMAFCMTGVSAGLAQPSFEFGLRGGLGLSKLSGSDLEVTQAGTMDLGSGYTGVGAIRSSIKDMKAGFVGGAYATVHVNPRFGVRVEALYTMKGGKGDNTGSIDVYDPSNNFVGTMSLTGTNRMTLNYFELPVLGVLSFPAGPTSTFELFAGPAFAFRTTAEIKEEDTVTFMGQAETQSATTDIKDSIKGTDFGGVLGAGMTFKIGEPVLFAEARWTAGFTKIDDAADGADWKNNAFGFQVGVGFPLISTSR